MKAKLIINPAAGKRSWKRSINTIVNTLAQKGLLSAADFSWTAKAGDAFHIARTLKPGQYDFVLAVGGDGTINEVVNGLMHSQSVIPLAIFPTGTVNDFATYLRLPSDPASYAAMLQAFQVKRIDVGQCNTTYFLNVAAGGLLTDIAYKVPGNTKAILGSLAYYLEGMRDLLPGHLNQTTQLTFTTADTSFTLDTVLFLVSNTTSIGGFRNLIPNAKIDDGLLDVLIFEKLAWRHWPSLVSQLLADELTSHPKLRHFQTTTLRIAQVDSPPNPYPIDLDGELVGDLPISIRVLQQALPLIVPVSLAST